MKDTIKKHCTLCDSNLL